MKYFACFFIVIAMLFVSSCNKAVEEESYQVDEFSIVLDSSFKQKDASGAYAYFISREYLVVCIKEEFSSLGEGYGEFSEKKYAEIVCASNEKPTDCIKNEEGSYYLEYTATAEKKEYYYNSFIKKGESAFYIITFTAKAEKDNSSNHLKFTNWFSTVDVE